MPDLTPARILGSTLLLLSAPMTTAADSNWRCQADNGNWQCAAVIDAKPASKQQTLVSPEGGDRFRQAYPAGYASEQQVLTQQQQDRQLWLDRERRSSNPAGADRAQQLYLDAPFAYLDWYTNPTGISPLSHCQGSYIQPSFDFADQNLPAEQQAIEITADSSRTQNDTLTELEGDVHLRQGKRHARAQQARVNHTSNQAQLSGLVQIREPGMLLLGDQARLDIESSQAELDQAQFLFHNAHLRGQAEQVTHLPSGELLIDQGGFTRCQPGNDSWAVKGSEILLRPDAGIGEVTHATIRLWDVPVFYVPYLQFPIDDRRMSGFLYPTIGYSEEDGLDYAQPYYFNLAPNFDDTLTLRHIGKRGTLLENEFRYLDDRFGHFTLSGSYMDSDDRFDDQKRWLVGVDHRGSPAPYWGTFIDYTKIRDDDHFEDLGTELDQVNEQSHLDQLARVSYRGINHHLNAQLRDYQTIDDDAEAPYRQLPSLQFNGDPDWLGESINFNYLTHISSFDRDQQGLAGIDRINGERVHLEAELELPVERIWGYLRPSVKLLHTEYRLEDQDPGIEEQPSRSLPIYSLDAGLFFDRHFEYDGERYTQTLEPRLFLLEVPFRDQNLLPSFDSSELTFSYNQLFRDNRFSGFDRYGDTSQATLATTTRLLDGKGQERGYLGIGQIFYFDDREVRLNSKPELSTNDRSDLITEGLWNITDRLRLTAEAQWDQGNSDNVVRNLKLGYRHDNDRVLNIGYRFTDESIEQTELSAIWPISTQWSLMARWQRDLLTHESLDSIFAVEYENCCWLIRTSYRQWVTDDDEERTKEGIFVQFVLKGLTGVGARAAGDSGDGAEDFLQEITGFEERNYYE